MKLYLDASALTKRYIAEKGSEKLDELFLLADSIVVSVIGLPEIISALSRLHREKKLDSRQYRQCKQAVIEDFENFEICQLTGEVIAKTVAILEHSNLRAADAIHVASAIESKSTRFVSGDTRQVAAAKKFHSMVQSV